MGGFQRIPCVIMRGGTSRGPFFLASDLPPPGPDRDAVLLDAVGAGHELQVDGIGGANPQTSKVAIIARSALQGCDVDYLFTQVHVAERSLDASPNCGNMLSAVGPFAIEQGLVPARDGLTTVRIHNVNTGKLIEAVVQTPGGRVRYDGDVRIDGVPGSAAPVHLRFLNAAGALTGALLPTGRPVDHVDGLDVSCIDAAMPVVLIRATDLGCSGHEAPAELEANPALMARLRSIRLAAGLIMGLGDVTDRVVPKPVLVATPRAGGTLTGRYFVPDRCHRAFAVTGAVAVATACAVPGTLAAELAGDVPFPRDITIEHPSGRIALHLASPPAGSEPVVSLVRTARRIFDGAVYVPALPRAVA
jgi:hypothetical protein